MASKKPMAPTVRLGPRALYLTIPAIRLSGFVALSVLVAAQQMLSGSGASWETAAWFSATALGYSLATWVGLWRLKASPRLKMVAARISEADLLFWTWAVGITGGAESWLVPLMVLRAADHVSFGYKRVLVLGHLSTLLFLAVLAFSRGFNLTRVPATDWVAVASVYGVNLYLAWSAAAVDRLNSNLAKARRARELLEKARDTAERAHRAKSEFLANMTHELRTPLNAVIGYAELLQEEHGESSASLTTDLGRIRDAGKHLLGLVNSVLDLSKIEAGRMTPDLQPCDVTALVRETTALLSPMAAAKGLTLSVEAQGEVWGMVDAPRVRQVLFNLLGNACKFTERGYVRVTATQETWRGRSTVVLRIADSGIGMTPAETERIFEEFVQVDASTTRRHGGTGLGLALSRRFCELMHGTLDVSSRAGAGSEFTVRLPGLDAHVLERAS